MISLERQINTYKQLKIEKNIELELLMGGIQNGVW